MSEPTQYSVHVQELQSLETELSRLGFDYSAGIVHRAWNRMHRMENLIVSVKDRIEAESDG